MKSPQTISLFNQQSDLGPRPVSFAASILLHIVTLALVLFGLAYRPPVTNIVTAHYSMRELDLQIPDEQMRAVRDSMPHPSPAANSHALASAGSPSSNPPAPRPKVEAKLGPQTILQPDLPKPVVLQDRIPLPQVVIWAPNKIQVKKIVPPLPEKPTTADVKPNVERPNDEMNLADVNIASSFRPSPKSIVPPSTTSPVAIPIPQQVQLPPISVTQPSAPPTPTAIVSLSDLRMKNGTVALPPVNEAQASNSQSVLSPSLMRDLSLPAKDIPASNPGEGSGQGSAGNASNSGAGAGQGSAAKANNSGAGATQGPTGKTGSGAAGKPNASGPAIAAGKPNASASPQGSESGADTNEQLTSTQISLPRTGSFGAVVVGDSLQEEYPEVGGVWNGRLAYTVYLHVGLARNWIMQYALPRSADAASAGTVIHLDAPWPYSIVRPNLAAGSVDADAIMIHGFINQSGHFELLNLVVPQAFPQAQFVLAALSKWQFRPALQDGQSARVEVLIIIPIQFD